MQRQRDELVPVAEALADLGGPVKAIHEVSPQARHHFTQADQVNQLVSASEADPDLREVAQGPLRLQLLDREGQAQGEDHEARALTQPPRFGIGAQGPVESSRRFCCQGEVNRGNGQATVRAGDPTTESSG